MFAAATRPSQGRGGARRAARTASGRETEWFRYPLAIETVWLAPRGAFEVATGIVVSSCGFSV